MKTDRRLVRQVLRRLGLSVVVTGLLASTVSPAQAHAGARGTVPVAATAQRGAVQLNTEQSVITAADRDLIINVRLAGLWEGPAGQMAMKKGVEPRVREIGEMIAAQHAQLDELDRVAAKKLGIELPNRPNALQQRWLDEMADATGPEFDAIYVARLRVAHGKIFPIIGAVRASTENSVVRQLAQDANKFVITHLTLLESTGLVAYEELPTVAAPATGPIAAAQRRSTEGGIAVPLIWLILGFALVAGMVATTRMVRPRSFGGRHSGVFAREEPEPAPVRDPDYLYPPARSMRARSYQ